MEQTAIEAFVTLGGTGYSGADVGARRGCSCRPLCSQFNALSNGKHRGTRMALPTAYLTSRKRLPDMFEAFKTAQAPEKFT